MSPENKNNPEIINPMTLTHGLDDLVYEHQSSVDECIYAMAEVVGDLTDVEIDIIQAEIQNEIAIRSRLHDVIIEERIKRNPPNQVGFYG